MTLENKILSFSIEVKDNAKEMFDYKVMNYNSFKYFVDIYTEEIIKIVREEYPTVSEKMLLDLLFKEEGYA